MSTFQDILSMPMDDIKPPKPLPIGEYIGLIDGSPEVTQRGKNNNHCVVFPIRLAQPVRVDQLALTEALDGKALTDVKLNYTLWLTPDSVHRLKSFLVDHLGIEAGNLNEAISQAPGKQLMVSIGHYVSSREGEAPRVGMEIKATAKA
jgi:hypothetical protein